MIITGPGFYTSKAGKCEAETESKDGLFAFGKWNSLPVIWRKRDGMAIAAGWCSNLEALNITSALIEPRKPAEWFAWVNADNEIVGPSFLPSRWRRIRVREVEDSNGNG